MTDTTGPTPTAAAVLEALRLAGWLLEQDTQTELTKSGFVVTPGTAFPDPDDNTTSREIDAMGWKTLVEDKASRITVGIRVLAECKQSAMPYVVIGRNSLAHDRTTARPEQTFLRESVAVERIPSPEGGSLLRSVPSHHYLGLDSLPPWSDEFIGTQMTRLDLKGGKWSAGNDGIFTSLVYPLAKASNYFHKQTKDVPGAIELRFPVVVTSAPVYQVNVDREALEPVVVPWSTLARNITSASLQGTFHFDIVSYASLSRYLSERIEPVAEALRAIPAERFAMSEDMSWVRPARVGIEPD
ncbi:hypothetical protein J2X85_004223 [Microbacterium trichothecenolyticum]|uniref:hypothetical protein n=1 Tax=Microbacterium trichothecenolyticum TaxID=69370 RepID=UPI0028591AE5|nr:hypothetical protein [Microbacterium trichothecenolyticum]MDR7187153.1 hypothetical protein [Microbacterium trichothecenolyticum]